LDTLRLTWDVPTHRPEIERDAVGDSPATVAILSGVEGAEVLGCDEYDESVGDPFRILIEMPPVTPS
jgi:hypothetical protein